MVHELALGGGAPASASTVPDSIAPPSPSLDASGVAATSSSGFELSGMAAPSVVTALSVVTAASLVFPVPPVPLFPGLSSSVQPNIAADTRNKAPNRPNVV